MRYEFTIAKNNCDKITQLFYFFIFVASINNSMSIKCCLCFSIKQTRGLLSDLRESSSCLDMSHWIKNMTGQEFSYCAESDTCHHMTIILELLFSSIFIWPSNTSSRLYSNSIWSNLSSIYLKKHTHLTLYQLHNYSLTASFSCKTNTKFSIFYKLVFLTKKYNKKNLPTFTALS